MYLPISFITLFDDDKITLYWCKLTIFDQILNNFWNDKMIEYHHIKVNLADETKQLLMLFEKMKHLHWGFP